eukprot:9128431-Lingulodinium_polyedra.AAC.1
MRALRTGVRMARASQTPCKRRRLALAWCLRCARFASRCGGTVDSTASLRSAGNATQRRG